ncbi:MAG: DUF5655 domain-containing protein [Actinomycetota bacterium]
MATWTCEECGREFGSRGQGHMCAPGVSLEDFFAGGGPWLEPVFEAVHGHLSTLDGELIVDPLERLVQFKHGPVFCAIRSMKKWAALSFSLGHEVTSSRISRKVVEHHGRYHHVLNVSSADDIDDEVREWLTEAFYLRAPGRPSSRPSSADPMVPDDVDVDIV